MITLLAATTSASNSADFYNSKKTTRTVVCAGLTAAETGQLQIKLADNTYLSMGSAYQMTATAPAIVVYGDGTYRVAKSATASPASVQLSNQ